jgi:hypothetical protein
MVGIITGRADPTPTRAECADKNYARRLGLMDGSGLDVVYEVGASQVFSVFKHSGRSFYFLILKSLV